MKTAASRSRFHWERLFGPLLVGVLLWKVDVLALAEDLRAVDIRLLTIASAINLPLVLWKSLRWRTLLASQSIVYSVSRAYAAYFGSTFIGFLTPGRLGEFVKALHLTRDCAVSTGQALSSVLADRLFDFFALLLVGGIAAASLSGLPYLTVVIVGVATVVLLLSAAQLDLLFHKRAHLRFQEILARSDRLGHSLHLLQVWTRDLRLGLRQLSLLRLLSAAGLTVLAQCTVFLQAWLLARALGLELSMVEASLAVALGNLVALAPVSVAGLGTREAAIVAFLRTVGVPSGPALSFSVLIFVTFYVVGGLIGAVAWWLKPLDLGAVREGPADWKTARSGRDEVGG